METSDIIMRAALAMVEMDPSINIDEAKKRIMKHTGFPATKENRDKSYTRLSWDSYFMSLAFLVAMRSPDSQTQHGCVIVDPDNRVISTGYNGFLQGANDLEMPNKRPEKYQHIIHSEVNAILAAKQDLKDCMLYVTGPPCNECLKLIAKVGIKNIVIGDRGHVTSDGYLELHTLICSMHNINVRKFIGKLAYLDGREIEKDDSGYAKQ